VLKKKKKRFETKEQSRGKRKTYKEPKVCTGESGWKEKSASGRGKKRGVEEMKKETGPNHRKKKKDQKLS